MAVFTGNGSAASPSLTFSSDTNTGIFRPGADQIGLTTAGARRVFIDSSGRIGLPTSTPAVKLHLSGEENPTIRLNTSKGDDSWSTTSSYGGIEFFSPDFEYGGNGETASIRFGVGTAFGTQPSLRFFVSAPSGGNANPAERMRLTSAGRLGIGTTAPAESLEVVGNIHVSGADRSIFNRSNNALSFGTNNAERARISATGDLLIGGTLPSAPNLTLTSAGVITANGSITTRGEVSNSAVITADPTPTLSGLANGGTSTFDVTLPLGSRAILLTLAASSNGGANQGHVFAILTGFNDNVTRRRNLTTITSSGGWSFSGNTLSGAVVTITITNGSGFTGHITALRALRTA
jgi:hypothetical protein